MKIKPEFVPDPNAKGGFSHDGRYSFKCPGCGHEHFIHTLNPMHNGAIWDFNGDVDKPTFSPSVRVMRGHYVPGQPKPPDCPNCQAGDNICGQCHFFIREGKIDFCGDCTHPLNGKTGIDLPEISN
jgi:hypothetical protein